MAIHIWLELEPEPKLWTKPEPKINKFGSAALLFIVFKIKIYSKIGKADLRNTVLRLGTRRTHR